MPLFNKIPITSCTICSSCHEHSITRKIVTPPVTREKWPNSVLCNILTLPYGIGSRHWLWWIKLLSSYLVYPILICIKTEIVSNNPTPTHAPHHVIVLSLRKCSAWVLLLINKFLIKIRPLANAVMSHVRFHLCELNICSIFIFACRIQCLSYIHVLKMKPQFV